MSGQQFVAHWRVHHVANLRASVDFVQQFEGVEGEDSEFSICAASSGSKRGIRWVEADGLDSCAMLAPFSQHLHLLEGKKGHLIVVSSSCDHIPGWGQLQPANLLIVSLVAEDLAFLPRVPNAHVAVPSSRTDEIVSATDRADSPQVRSLKAFNLLPLYVQQRQLASIEAHCHFATSRKKLERTDGLLFLELVHLADPCRTARPHEQSALQSDSDVAAF